MPWKKNNCPIAQFLSIFCIALEILDHFPVVCVLCNAYYKLPRLSESNEQWVSIPTYSCCKGGILSRPKLSII